MSPPEGGPTGPNQNEQEKAKAKAATVMFLGIDPASTPEEFVAKWQEIVAFNNSIANRSGDPLDGAPVGFEATMLDMGFDVKKYRGRG